MNNLMSVKVTAVFNFLVFLSVASIYSYFEIVFFPAVCVIALLALFNLKKNGSSIPAILYLIFSIYVLLSLFWTYNEQESVKASFYIFFLYLTVFLSVIVIGSDQSNVKSFVYACILGFLVVNLRNFFSEQTGFYRLGGVAGQSNALGLISSASAILCFSYYVLFYSRSTTVEKLFLLATGLLSVYFLVRSGSRGAFISLLVPVVFYYFRFKTRIRLRSIFYVVLAILVIAFIVMQLANTPLFNRLLLLPSAIGLDFGTVNNLGYDYKEAGDSSRVYIAEIVLKEFLNNPVLGHGLGSFKYFSEFSYTHNSFLEMIFSLGILGMLVFYFPLLFVFVKSFRSGFSVEERRVRKAIQSLVLYFLLSGLSIPNFQNKSQIYSVILILVLYSLLVNRRTVFGGR